MSYIDPNRKPCKSNENGCTGAHFDNDSHKWRARIGFKGQKINLGLLENLEDAIKTRKMVEETYYKSLFEERKHLRDKHKEKQVYLPYSHIVDITGKKYGFLEVVKFVGHIGEKYMWLYKCECGNKIIISSSELKEGKHLSCCCKGKIRKKYTHHTQKSFNDIYKAGTMLTVIMRKEPNEGNSSGIKGIYFNRNGWYAKLVFQGGTYRKRFKTKEEAIIWRKHFECEHFEPMLEKHKIAAMKITK